MEKRSARRFGGRFAFHQQTWSHSDGELMDHSAHTFGTSFPGSRPVHFFTSSLFHSFTSSLFHFSLFTFRFSLCTFHRPRVPNHIQPKIPPFFAPTSNNPINIAV